MLLRRHGLCSDRSFLRVLMIASLIAAELARPGSASEAMRRLKRNPRLLREVCNEAVEEVVSEALSGG